MESLNHDMNDMDALFRRAAENYPLKSGEGDWENISIKLIAKTDAAVSIKKNRFRKYTGLFLFLFLILSSLVFYPEFQNENNHSDRIKMSKDPLNQDGQSSVTPLRDDHTYRKADNSSSGQSKAGDVSPKETKGRVGSKQIRSKQIIYSERATENPEIAVRFFNHFVSQKPNSLSIYTLAGDDSIVTPSMSNRAHLFTQLETDSKDQLSIPDLSGHNKTSISQNAKGIYLGLTGGIDFSEIKSQAIDGSGYNLGLLTGYRFHQKISVESGIMWSQKKYYTDGKYFNMKAGSSMPVNMKIINVQGQLSLFEIPLKLKYDLLYRRKSNLFISTGILSNIYLRERNIYLTEMNGVQEHQIGLYNDIVYSLASLINISAGYERAIGKSHTIRFEPYIKIPLKKVGVGNLPVFSTGMNLSVLNSFSRKKN